MAREHILIVEDETKLGRVLQEYLENSGYQTSFLDNGEMVVSFVKSNAVDLILLDIMLPGMDGLSVCRQIREFSNIPILFITAKVEEIDVLLGLEMGSDDYICKPFRPREVVARVKAVLRRAGGDGRAPETRIGVMALKEEEHLITIRDTALILTPNEFGILKAFINRPNKVFTRAELVAQVQGYGHDGYDRTVDSHIKNLRKKLAGILPGREIIKSVYGVGYRMDSSQLS